MGSGSSSRLQSETVRINSTSQDFNTNHKQKNKFQRFSYCSIDSQANHSSIYENHYKQQQYYKFPVNQTNQSNTLLAPNRFKSFENFIAPAQAQKADLIQSKQAVNKSLVNYEINFDKFSNLKQEKIQNNRSFKAIQLQQTSSIYHDLIKLDKDLEKRENDLKQQTSYQTYRNSSASNSETSSGCSSATSSSNLSVSRRKSAIKEQSIYSVSNSTTFKSGIKEIQIPSVSTLNINKESSSLLTSSSLASTASNKSILSTTSANLSSSCSSISSPTEYFSPKSVTYTKSNKEEQKKRAHNRRGLINKTKSECFYKEDSCKSSDQNFDQKSKKGANKTRDSGIITDLFHLNGSMTNIKTKLNNVKSNLRNSFSQFNLKHSAVPAKKKERNLISETAVCSSMSLNKIIENDFNRNANLSAENETKRRNSKENKITTTSTNSGSKSKLNTISSSINNFLSNLATNNNIIKNSNNDSFISNTNLASTNDTHTSINNKKQIIINNKTDSKFDCTNNNSHSMSLSTNNLNETNKLIRINQPVNQQLIKRTMTFHATNDEPNTSAVQNSTKLINSKTITTFKPKLQDNLIPIISIEKRQKEMKHSVSMSSKPTSSLQQVDDKSLASHKHQKIVVQASTSDLLNCFSIFIAEKCAHLLKETYINPLNYLNKDIGKRVKFEPRDTINWLRSADRALLIQGWQEIAFMNPVNVVFVYLLVRDTLNDTKMNTVYELQCTIMACLYLAFSYMGNEISYPLKPFLIEENRDIFWQRTVDLMNKLSSCMLKINRDPRFFTELFYELKSYSIVKVIQQPSVLTPTCYKQLSDQMNSIEIKIDSFGKNKLLNEESKLKSSQDSSNKLYKQGQSMSTVQLNESTRLRTGLYNENQNPFNTYCI